MYKSIRQAETEVQGGNTDQKVVCLCRSTDSGNTNPRRGRPDCESESGDARERWAKVRVSQKPDGVMRGKFSPPLRDFLLTGGVRWCKCSKDTMNPGFLGWLGGT